MVQDAEKADSWLEEMRRLEIEPDFMCYSSIISAHANANNPWRAAQVFKKLHADHGSNALLMSSLCRCVIKSFMAADDIAGAAHWLAFMRDEHLWSPTKHPVLLAKAALGNVWSDGNGEVYKM